MKCPKCGSEQTEGARFCTNCGYQFEVQPQQQPEQPQQPQQQPQQYQQPQQPQQYQQQQPQQPQQYQQVYRAPETDPAYKPISMWGYFGYELLFAIPCVGLIVLLVFAFGGTANKNVKNFARSYFCFLIVILIIIAVLAAMGLLAGIVNSPNVYRIFHR